VKHFVLI